MYNALIVDDEKSILENIQKAIPWEELGILCWKHITLTF